MTDDDLNPPAQTERPHRAIKSFVMRSGRMTEGQQRGLDQGWPKFGLEPSAGLQNFDQLFGRQAPRTFEIGFGMGQATLEMAAAAPATVSIRSKQDRRVISCSPMLPHGNIGAHAITPVGQKHTTQQP